MHQGGSTPPPGHRSRRDSRPGKNRHHATLSRGPRCFPPGGVRAAAQQQWSRARGDGAAGRWRSGLRAPPPEEGRAASAAAPAQGGAAAPSVSVTPPRPRLAQLLPDQLVLLLETLLEEKTLCPRTLQRLQKLYSLREQDAEVRHRWCELVVKHKYTAAYGDLETFLREDQAMGVYLYGELMVNEDAKQQELARRCFAAVQDEMDASTLRVVQEMLF